MQGRGCAHTAATCEQLGHETKQQRRITRFWSKFRTVVGRPCGWLIVARDRFDTCCVRHCNTKGDQLAKGHHKLRIGLGATAGDCRSEFYRAGRRGGASGRRGRPCGGGSATAPAACPPGWPTCRRGDVAYLVCFTGMTRDCGGGSATAPAACPPGRPILLPRWHRERSGRFTRYMSGVVEVRGRQPGVRTAGPL